MIFNLGFWCRHLVVNVIDLDNPDLITARTYGQKWLPSK